MNLRACFPDQIASVLCSGGINYKTCKGLSDENKEGTLLNSAGTAALSAIVAAGILLAAVI